jgi:crotonobetaine/carnitine-CoA ligase
MSDTAADPARNAVRLPPGPGDPAVILAAIPWDDRTIQRLLLTRLAEEPDEVAATVSGEALTWRQLHGRAARVAAILAHLGLAAGDVAAQMTGNTPDHVAFVFGAALLGAIECPVNTALQGDSLAHVITHSTARVVFAERAFAPQLEAVAAQLVGVTVVFWGEGDAPVIAGGAVRTFAHPGFGPLPEAPVASVRPQDPSTMIYTSGTTGKAKGVLLPHHFTFATAAIKVGVWGLSRDDVLLTPLPLFHSNGRYSTLMTGLLVHAGVHVLPRFSATSFWPTVRETGATEVGSVGTMGPILLARDPSPDDRNHRVRMMHGAGTIPPERRAEFEERFGIRLVNGFAMTETGHFSTISPDDPSRYKASGRAVPGFDMRILDEHDEEVPRGEVGELCIRPLVPYSMLLGYWRQPEVTLETFQNFWFHTGDLATIDEDGLLDWKDRKKDAIRRRGEMISSIVVENAAAAHPAVGEAAVFGVPGALGEEEVFLYVTAAVAGEALDLAEIHATMTGLLPAFAVPAYVAQLDVLPRSATLKIDKKALKAGANPAAAWRPPG